MTENKSSNRNWLILFIIISIILAIVLGIIIGKYNKTQETLQAETEAKNLLISEKNDLLGRLNAMQLTYDSLKREHQGLDSLFTSKIAEIEILKSQIKKERIVSANFKNKVEGLEFEKNDLMARIAELKAKNDSLSTANLEIQNALDSSLDMNLTLTNKIKTNAVIRAYKVEAHAYQVKKNNKEIATKKAKKINKINTCFTIGQNSLLEKGNRTCRVRIEGPDGKVLNSDAHSDPFINNGNNIGYSAKEELYYDNQAMDQCITWNANTLKLEKGIYYVQVYINDTQVGITSFSLE
ncbi:hypothetical protein ACFL6I_12820 [candidate division KSB1 bacterium]